MAVISKAAQLVDVESLSTKMGENSTEFMRQLSTGSSLSTCIRRKYCISTSEADDDSFSSSSDCESEVDEEFSSAIVVNDVQLPGRKLPSGNLQLIVINGKNISKVGNLSPLQGVLDSITELDLASNRLSDWDDIFNLLALTPSLGHLNLSHNPLQRWKSVMEWFDSKEHTAQERSLSLPKLKSMVLNGTNVDWVTICYLLSVSACVEELHLSLNDYSKSVSDDLLRISNEFPNIHVLHVNDCRINEWKHLLRILEKFPALETLVAMSNPIMTVASKESQECSTLGCLQLLNMSQWDIRSWCDIEAVNGFPVLNDLRAQRIPFLDSFDDETRRMLTIARLPDITSLNGSPVTSEHREDAERFFLRYYAAYDDKPSRYAELESVHGRLEPLAIIDLTAPQRVCLLIKFEDKVEYRVFSVSLTISELKKELAEFCGLHPTRMRVFLQQQIGFGPEELQLPRVKLHSKRIAEGDELIVQEKTVLTPRKQQRTTSCSVSESDA